MGSIYNKYVKLKENDDKYLYLFKSGNFYIFLDEDAIKVSRVTLLKLTNYSNDIYKCGFPVSSIDKYLELFENLNLKVKVVENNSIDKYLSTIKELDINNISYEESKDILFNIKELL